ncbi:GTPase ObgE [bacterium]|nr:GTPase ObgE [bacterium]
MSKFVDELKIHAKAGDGGDGVVRWHRFKFKPRGGPAGGNGGRGGDVYVRAVRDLNLLAKYTGLKSFAARNGVSGHNSSMHGKASEDLYIDVPIGSTVTDLDRDRQYELLTEGQVEKVLHGGGGGLGNEYFKSSTNQAPVQSTKGKPGEEGEFLIEVSLAVDVGLIGLPNAGKSTLINLMTNSGSRIGEYPFTTLEPHLGDLHGYVIADIPGLIAGAAEGKGLGYKFLRHTERTKMLLHLVSLDQPRPLEDYNTVRNELSAYSKILQDKEEWIIFTKKDLVNKGFIEDQLKEIDTSKKRVFVISQNDMQSHKNLRDELVRYLSVG